MVEILDYTSGHTFVPSLVAYFMQEWNEEVCAKPLMLNIQEGNPLVSGADVAVLEETHNLDPASTSDQEEIETMPLTLTCSVVDSGMANLVEGELRRIIRKANTIITGGWIRPTSILSEPDADQHWFTTMGLESVYFRIWD